MVSIEGGAHGFQSQLPPAASCQRCELAANWLTCICGAPKAPEGPGGHALYCQALRANFWSPAGLTFACSGLTHVGAPLHC